MVQRVFLVTLTCLLFGCAAPREFYRPNSTAISRPAIGQETTARPGENLLEQGTQSEYDAIELTSPVTFTALGSFVLPAGRYLKTGQTSSYEAFSGDDGLLGPIVSGGESLQELVLLNGGKVALLKTISGKLYGADNAPFRRIKATVLDRASFQQALIYSGKVGNKITLSYREFSGGLARGAFTNNAEYDLSESKLIGYQGAQIEVIEANNLFIRYKLVSNFSKTAR